MTVRYRDGGAADIAGVVAVMSAAFDSGYGEAWNQAQCLGILSLPDTWLILAEGDGGEPVGFALSRMVVDDAELLLLAVTPAAQRQGIASALIDRAATVARAKAAERLLLEVRDGNAAIDLYRRAGFAPIGRRAAYYRGPCGIADALTLARSLA
jgi:[ribosomal protein S18]-alanine N-acetyltransferase